MKNKKISITIVFALICSICHSQNFIHNFDFGLNNHIYKRLNYGQSRPTNKYTKSTFINYGLEYHNSKYNTFFKMDFSYRNNKFKYDYDNPTRYADVVHFFNYGRPQLGISLMFVNKFKFTNKIFLQLGCGLGMLVSTNEIIRNANDGEKVATIYPKNNIDSVYYYLSTIHQNTICPTVTCALDINYYLNANIVLCMGIKCETGFIDSQSQLLLYNSYIFYGNYSTILEFASTSNTSIIFTTGIKFSNNIFKKTKK